MQRCPCSVKRMGAISIVDGDVCVNMLETAYALPVWRRGPFVSAGTKGPEVVIYSVFFCRKLTTLSAL